MFRRRPRPACEMQDLDDYVP
eukprot:COSAG02_NODE_57542_length_280_cov_0.740331_1_plen_20_part_01